MDRLYLDHYARLLSFAKIALDGPKSVKIRDQFWGGRTLSLSRMRIPKIEGTIESITIYSNPMDSEQTRAILRWTRWDADSARRSTQTDAELGRPPSIALPVVDIRSAWVDMQWVEQSINRLERIQLPLKSPYFQSTSKVMHQLRLERVDNTLIDIVWKAETTHGFEPLEALWQALWDQMKSLLRDNEVVNYEELWETSHQMLQPTHTYSNLLE